MGEKGGALAAAAGEEPPAKKVASSPGKEYTFQSIRNIPQHLRAKKIQSFFVEFLDLDQERLAPDQFDEDGMRTNSCMIRLVFQHKQDHDTDHALAGTVGIVIELQHDGGWGAKCSDGDLLVKTVSYDGPHRYTVKARELPIRQRGRNRGSRVKDFLQVLDDHTLLPCGFNTEKTTITGCRDFMSQYIFRLNQLKVLNLPERLADEVFGLFNYNYGPAMDQQRNDGVGYAAFNGLYHMIHYPIHAIAYRGNCISRDSDEANEAT